VYLCVGLVCGWIGVHVCEYVWVCVGTCVELECVVVCGCVFMLVSLIMGVCFLTGVLESECVCV